MKDEPTYKDKSFRNFYIRMHDHVPPIMLDDVLNNGRSFKVEYREVLITYSTWLEDVLRMIDETDGISKKNKEIVKGIVNARDFKYYL